MLAWPSVQRPSLVLGTIPQDDIRHAYGGMYMRDHACAQPRVDYSG